MALVPPHTHPRHEHSQYLTLAEASAAGLFLPLAGGTLTGALTVDGGAGALSLKPGASNDHVYMQFFADSQASGTRSAYFGFGSAGTNLLSLVNEMTNGSILLGTNGTGRVTVSADPTSALGVATKQYVDNADATKAPLTGTGTSGTWPINVTGNAGSVAGLAVHAGRNNEANKIVRTDGSGYLQVGYVNSSWGDENNASGPPRIWGTNGSDNYMRSYQSAYLNQVHSHSRTGAGYGAWSVDVGSLAAGTSYGPWYVGHAWPGSPAIIISDAVFDDGVHSVDTSIGTWDTVNTGVTAKNNHTAAESCVIVGISVI